MNRFGPICFLVGPNGSGKSRFAEALRQHLPQARLLGTDRLEGTGRNVGFGFLGDNLQAGFRKDWFGQFKNAGINYGSGIDTYILLEERPDIRVLVEATLSSLFGRKISLEWDSGHLVPKATSFASGQSYRIDKDECHGIRELLVLLTHLYDDTYKYLIIDEPELNLHPQYQSFFMQEVRKIAGNPNEGGRRKGVFLVTHSPFMIDVKGLDDLRSLFSFSSTHELPASLTGVDGSSAERLSTLIPRLNVHHKQLFFSDNPIFVEGILDAQIVEAVQERRQVSITSAGSCIIDVGGCEEVTKYVELCRLLKKRAFFLYDLDSLFIGNLRRCIRNDGTVAEFLAELGVGSDFGRYCGELDRLLGDAVQRIRASHDQGVAELRAYIEELADGGDLRDQNLARARVAVLIDLAGRAAQVTAVISPQLAADIQGRLTRVCEVLAARNVHVLPGGALEHYLPSYAGARYTLSDSAKKAAVEQEVSLLATGQFDGALGARYGALLAAIERLPAKEPVDLDAVLKEYLGDFVHALQGMIVSHKTWGEADLNRHFQSVPSGLGKLFTVTEFRRIGDDEFTAVIVVAGIERRIVRVSHETNAGMRKFEFEQA